MEELLKQKAELQSKLESDGLTMDEALRLFAELTEVEKQIAQIAAAQERDWNDLYQTQQSLLAGMCMF